MAQMTEPEFWDRIARNRIALRASGGAAREIEWEGDDPEALFAALALDAAAIACSVLDIGCGEGRFTRELSGAADRVVGIDLSETAISEAVSGDMPHNLSFVGGDSRRMPFEDAAFGLVCSRRGPVSDSEVLREVRRVMKPGAQLIALMPGESHRIETQEIFGRGMGWPPSRPVRFTVPEMLREAGLELVFFTECYGASYCADIAAFAAHLGSIPVIPDFDPAKDEAMLREVGRKLATPRGIRDTEHMAVFVARKP